MSQNWMMLMNLAAFVAVAPAVDADEDYQKMFVGNSIPSFAVSDGVLILDEQTEVKTVIVVLLAAADTDYGQKAIAVD